jgi:hypothetical protein
VRPQRRGVGGKVLHLASVLALQPLHGAFELPGGGGELLGGRVQGGGEVGHRVTGAGVVAPKAIGQDVVGAGGDGGQHGVVGHGGSLRFEG